MSQSSLALDSSKGALRRPRVLQLSYACSPVRGSEGGTGWQRAVRSAKYFDTWVICEEHEFADEIRNYLAANGEIPGLKFVFVPIDQREWSWGQVHDSIWYAVLRRWHQRAFRAAKRLHAEIGFDLTHLVTFCGYREPSYLWKMDVPFVWGPIGGTQNYPWRFLAGAGLRGALYETCRSVMNGLQLRLSLRVRSASRRAAEVLAANATVQGHFLRAQGIRPRTMFESGIAQVGGVPRKRDSRGEAIRILWSGLLSHRKALHLLLYAVARLPADVPCEVRVLGDGRLRKRWRRLAERLGVAEHVTWLGWVPHEEALRQYQWADLFAFTSLRDTSGNVVLEAMAAGVPVICLDHNGIREIVTERCGVKIPVTTPRRVIPGLAECIARLWRDPGEWERLSAGAVERAKDYLWSKQEQTMAALYREVVARRVRAGPDVGCGSCSNARGPQPAESSPMRPRSVAPRKGSRHTNNRPRSIMKSCVDNPFGILMYHRIAPPVNGVAMPTWNVTPLQLRRQLVGLLERGWQAWPLRQALAWRAAGEPVPRRTFLVTFDDGYDNVYQNAWPVLKELAVPATVFVVTGCLDGDRPFLFDNWTAAGAAGVPEAAWRPLTAAHCAEMIAHGLVEIGSHTHMHGDLRGRPDVFQQDLARSVEVLRSRFGLTDVPFAFPFGHAGPDLTAAVRQTGVVCALTTEPHLVRPGEDPFTWGRFAVGPHDTAATLAFKLNGWYSELRALWRWLRRPRAALSSSRASRRNASKVGIELGHVGPSR